MSSSILNKINRYDDTVFSNIKTVLIIHDISLRNVSVLVDNDFFGANRYAVGGHWLKNLISLTINRDAHEKPHRSKLVNPTVPRVNDENGFPTRLVL